MKPMIRLFKAVPIKNKKAKSSSKRFLSETIKSGFIFAPEVIANYSDESLKELIKTVEKELCLTAVQANNAFHKSWKKVKNSSDEQLFFEQIIHYITTYGFEEAGCYDQNTVYIPSEKLQIPKLEKEKISITVIHGYTKEEIKEKLMKLLSGIALKEETIKDVIEVIDFVGINEKEIEDVKNKETRVILFDKLDKIPENPVELLRFMIYKATGKTLIIKSKKVIQEIKNSTFSFSKILSKYNLVKLSEIFYRFKPIFLAFRRSNNRDKNVNSFINKIRKLAVHNHKPMPEDYFNTITAKISSGKFDTEKFESKLKGLNVFRKIRLAYALNFRTKNSDSILYRIRNGKSYATAFNFKKKEAAREMLSIVLDSISDNVKKKVYGKKIYLPKNIVYSLPATEKQFTGNLPSGSYVQLGTDIVIGVHWENFKNKRVDLDLSLLSINGKIGWDSNYRMGNGDILFSGDMTDAPAPKGASEFFYVKNKKEQTCSLMLNYFNYEPDGVPFKIIIAKEHVKDFNKNYVVNPNNIITVVPCVIDKKQKMLGLLKIGNEFSRFYFCESNIGESITSRNTESMQRGKQWMIDYYTDSIEFKAILKDAGAIFVSNPEKADIDLSLEKLEKNTFINMLV